MAKHRDPFNRRRKRFEKAIPVIWRDLMKATVRVMNGYDPRVP